MGVLGGGVFSFLLLTGLADAVKRALIIIDMQNCFMEGGPLAVTDAETIVAPINELSGLEWNAVIFSEDFHPANSISFASQHDGEFDVAFNTTKLTYDNPSGKVCGEEHVTKYGAAAIQNCSADTTQVVQTLWPDHCVQNTDDQLTHADMNIPPGAIFVKKGFTTVIDSYGVFADNLAHHQTDRNDRKTMTGTENALEFWLAESNIDEVYIVGLAYDFCVKYSALQSQRRQFKTFVVTDATKPVDALNNAATGTELEEGGVVLMTAAAVKTMFEADRVQKPEAKALLIIDMQNDFITGSLAVADAEAIIDPINKLTALGWDALVFSEDYHPFDSISFASSHNKPPFDVVELQYNKDSQVCGDWKSKYGNSAAECQPEDVNVNVSQTLWPDHCVQGTDGQLTPASISVPEGSIFVKKGFNTVVDSYGVFGNNFEHLSEGRTNEQKLRATENALESWLRESNVTEVYVAGLAFDFCVKFSAIQAKRRGFKVFVIEDASRPVDSENNVNTQKELTDAGVELTTWAAVLNQFPTPAPETFPWVPIISVVVVVLVGVGVYFVTQPGTSSGNEGGVELNDA